MKHIVIISPSDAFYGSEQVLYDFLQETRNTYEVYVPKGTFYDILIKQSRHKIHCFGSLALLYSYLAARILSRQIDGVYINEGGHIRYLKLLARLFPSKQFFAHIRLKEDTVQSRLSGITNNLKLISISRYITRLIAENAQITAATILDLYKISNSLQPFKPLVSENIQIGIVGRVTDTKGIEYVKLFCDYIENAGCHSITLHFYGDIDESSFAVQSFIYAARNYKKAKCVFHGFVNDKGEIYNHINCLCHFNPIEALGRIAFEALNYGVPFIGFCKGGIGEIADCLGLSSFMVDPDNTLWCEQMYSNIIAVVRNEEALNTYAIAQRQMAEMFSPSNYVQQLEALFA